MTQYWVEMLNVKIFLKITFLDIKVGFSEELFSVGAFRQFSDDDPRTFTSYVMPKSMFLSKWEKMQLWSLKPWIFFYA
jgi:hypothetical protein